MTFRRKILAGLLLVLTTGLSGLLPSTSLAQVVRPPHPELVRLIAEKKSDERGGKFIAHRGIFHPSHPNSEQFSRAVPENSVAAINRARAMGLRMVEIDVRLSRQGTPYVVHDYILNRSTSLDNKSGAFNLLQYAYQRWAMPLGTSIRDINNADLNKATLKAYGPFNTMYVGGDLMSLEEFLKTFNDFSRHSAGELNRHPLLILDLQDPQTTKAAADVVQKLGLQKRVVLKFFANRAVRNIPNAGNTGPNKTIADWGNDLYYIIQINNGELNRKATDTARTVGINKYGKRWTPREYIDGFLKTGRMVGVGLSIPTLGEQVWARQAIIGTRDHYRKIKHHPVLIGVLKGPDAAVQQLQGKDCRLISFEARGNKNNFVRFSYFDITKHYDRINFARSLDYQIADIIPIFNPSTGPLSAVDYNSFEATWCPLK